MIQNYHFEQYGVKDWRAVRALYTDAITCSNGLMLIKIVGEESMVVNVSTA